MEKVIQVLSLIFYFIWIPLGLVLLAAVLYMMMANPFGRMMGAGPGGGPYGPPGGYGQGPPMRQDSPLSGLGNQEQPGNFGPPTASVAPH